MRRLSPYLIALLVLTNILGVVAWQRADAGSQPEVKLSEAHDNYPLLAKRIFYESPNDVIINFSPLRNALNTYFENNLPASNSFYFEYLPTGTSIRINSHNELVGASLLKLPVVMDLYKAEELGRLDMDSSVILRPEWLDSNFGTLYQRGAGTKITLREAAQYLLRESDNTALRAINASAGNLLKNNEHALVELDVPYKLENSTTTRIGAQSYTSMLKCLYFSCYLSKQNSQEILSLMAQAQTYGRLGDGLPQNVKFAHKIGTFSQNTQSDCGIIYLESGNYAICMLVDMPDTQSRPHFKAVSELVYQYLSPGN